MKRFIDLRGQIYCDDDLPLDEQEKVFAFFCTRTDTFESFNDTQEWSSDKEFIADYEGTQLERYLRLIPEWAKESENQNEANY